jgi:hypothetical protein
MTISRSVLQRLMEYRSILVRILYDEGNQQGAAVRAERLMTSLSVPLRRVSNGGAPYPSFG